VRAAQVRLSVEAQIRQMQALQQEFPEDHLQIFDLLGEGGFGAVYHGAMPTNPSVPRTSANSHISFT
jgi:hypothetical protein